MRFQIKWLFLLGFFAEYTRIVYKPEILNLFLAAFTILAYFWCDFQEKKQKDNEIRGELRLVVEKLDALNKRQDTTDVKISELNGKVGLSKVVRG
jgi:hypothetical protein